MNYLNQKASPWVSFTVLAGGLLTAVILFFLVRVEKSAGGVLSPSVYGDEFTSQLEDL